ncbi:ankyrin [Peniophora sp. CONT]|nr:ankyrin [Peniophora sp. CONT]
MPTPSDEELEDVVYAARYGDLDDVRAFIDSFGASALATAHDESGNTVLHMAAANGHTELLDYIIPLLPSSLLSAQNAAGSTALHWAALNSHLEAAKRLVDAPGGPGAALVDIRNAAGRSPLGEAENAGWEEGAKWMVEIMSLDEKEAKGEGDGDATVDPAVLRDVEIEIEDADGQVAKMSLSSDAPATVREPADSTAEST